MNGIDPAVAIWDEAFSSQPHPETVDILADVADYIATIGDARVAGNPVVIQSLTRFAGAGDDPAASPTVEQETEILKRLAAHAVCRIAILRGKDA